MSPKAILEILKRVKEEHEKRAPRAGMKQADLRYMALGLEGAIEAIAFLAEHETAVTKAAKNDVPWRKSA